MILAFQGVCKCWKRLFAAGLVMIFSLLFVPGLVCAGEVRVAVAANFTEPAPKIGALFEQSTGHKALFSFASTGQLYSQIAFGAPFEVFLSADQARAKAAVENGLAVPGSRFTYATGRIALYSPTLNLDHPKAVLKVADFSHLAIANPETAPYGRAAVEAMRAFGVFEALEAKLVRGNNVSQTYQFVKTGNAELGFLALSQIIGEEKGARWIVPANLHTPIAQDAVLLQKGAENEAAQAFLRFLKGPEAQDIKKSFGYE
jgi:molybdate transport system substrate-binding protein